MNNEQNESDTLSGELREALVNVFCTFTAVQLDPSLVQQYCWQHDPGGWDCQACREEQAHL